MNNYNLTPIYYYQGWPGTAGKLGCTQHTPNAHIVNQPQPFAILSLQCPWCGKDIKLDCFKRERRQS